MREKLTITKDNYKEVVLRKSIITCWVLLIICFIVKICGGNFFNISCDNEMIISICEFIDKSFVKHILHFVMFIFSSYMLIKIVNPEIKFKSKQNIISFILLIIVFIIKKLIEFKIIKLPIWVIDISDFMLLFIILFLNSRKVLKSIIAILLLFVFTLISTLTKNIGFSQIITDSFLINSVFMIDYYIMLVLTALYSKKINQRRKK